ncbi:MAG: lytic transglycosylase domain-containing protein [bacterium]
MRLSIQSVLSRIEQIQDRFDSFWANTVSVKQVIKGEEGEKSSFQKVLKEVISGKGASDYSSLINTYAQKYNLDSALIEAVINTESDFNPEAVSPKGALGLMQLMPATVRELGVTNPFDPAQNIEGGTRYLRSLLDEFKGDLPLALAAYNAGAKTVKEQGGIPPFKETQDYVKKVLGDYRGGGFNGGGR